MALISRTLDQEWRRFADQIFANVEPIPNQREEMEKAFYAGASAILAQFKAIEQSPLPEWMGIQIINTRLDECKKYAARLEQSKRKQEKQDDV